MATISDYFKGMTSKRVYGVCDAIEPIGGAHYGKMTEVTYRFEGVPESLITTTGTHSCTDVGGTTYVVDFTPAFTYDNSHLDYPHVQRSNAVSITRRSPHLYDIEIVEATHS